MSSAGGSMLSIVDPLRNCECLSGSPSHCCGLLWWQSVQHLLTVAWDGPGAEMGVALWVKWPLRAFASSSEGPGSSSGHSACSLHSPNMMLGGSTEWLPTHLGGPVRVPPFWLWPGLTSFGCGEHLGTKTAKSSLSDLSLIPSPAPTSCLTMGRFIHISACPCARGSRTLQD